MPLKPGIKPEVISANIKEMMAAGHSQKQAIAAAMSMKRKSKKMAEGGMVAEDYDEGCSSDFDENASRSIIEDNALGAVKEGEVASPESQDAEKMLAKKIYEAAEAEELSSGGMVGSGDGDSEKEKNMSKSDDSQGSPEMQFQHDKKAMDSEQDKDYRISEEYHPLEDNAYSDGGQIKSMLSDEARAAIEERKMKRRKMMGIPV